MDIQILVAIISGLCVAIPSIFTTILSRWSDRKKETPEEMYNIFSKLLDNKCIEYLLK